MKPLIVAMEREYSLPQQLAQLVLSVEGYVHSRKCNANLSMIIRAALLLILMILISLVMKGMLFFHLTLPNVWLWIMSFVNMTQPNRDAHPRYLVLFALPLLPKKAVST